MKFKYWTVGSLMIIAAILLFIPAFICECFDKYYNKMLAMFADKLDEWWDA